MEIELLFSSWSKGIHFTQVVKGKGYKFRLLIFSAHPQKERRVADQFLEKGRKVNKDSLIQI